MLFLLWFVLSISFFVVTSIYHIPFTLLSVYVLIGIFLSWLLTLAIVLFFATFVSPFVALFVSLIVYLL